ncbi:MAG: nucleotidyltransferase domain-containing protein [Bacteroidetes bacterium]|nr:nucleotidyltransferase domain-containing protein [Bacteroidota bacterium]MCL5031139.1 nucleotidyltransferase domain-containing protein [Bacteroidota bacterium]
MRLKKNEIEKIREVIGGYDRHADVYLFGSRVDDNKRGGDIDLLVFSNKLTFNENLKIKIELKKILGDQRIDLIIKRDKSDPFVDLIFDSSIKLA